MLGQIRLRPLYFCFAAGIRISPAYRCSGCLAQVLLSVLNIHQFINPHPSFTEQAKSLKDEGNEYFREKNYQKAIVSYTAGLKKNSTDLDINAVLYTNRAAAHFHLGEDIILKQVFSWSCVTLEKDTGEEKLKEKST